MATVDRCGYSGQQKNMIVTLVDYVHRYLKHTEASFLPNLIDLLCLRVTQVPRFPDLAIFVLTTDDDRYNQLLYPLLRMCMWGNYARFCSLYYYYVVVVLCSMN